MYLLVTDTETTGLDLQKDRIIELAAALYSVERRSMLWQFGKILGTTKENPCESVNKISKEDLEASDTSLAPLHALVSGSPVITAIVAHNAVFDRGFVEASPYSDIFARFPWVCSKEDIEYTLGRGSLRLAHLATDHGLPGHRQAHRALSDVLLLCDLLGKVDDLAEQIQAALKPKGLFQSHQAFARNEVAKAAGFRWDGAKKGWFRRMPLDTDLSKFEFRVTLVGKL